MSTHSQDILERLSAASKPGETWDVPSLRHDAPAADSLADEEAILREEDGPMLTHRLQGIQGRGSSCRVRRATDRQPPF
jgi:hypothetical protein